MSMSLTLTGLPRCQPHAACASLRLVLYAGEVLRLPQTRLQVRIVSGSAWVTFAGRDIVLKSGETTSFASGEDAALVSALEEAPLTIEILGDRPSRGA